MRPRDVAPPLFLQRLSGSEQTLVLLHVHLLRHPSGARTRDLLSLVEDFRLPRPANISTTLGRLHSKKWVRRAGELWQLTPEGEDQIRQLVGRVSIETPPTTPQAVGAPFGSVRHEVVPYWQAPDALRRPIARILESTTFDQNVLLITRYPSADEPDDPLHAAIEAIREALAEHGLHLHLASDRNAADGLFSNVVAHMWACRYGIALIEARSSPTLNQNVLIELGAMSMTGRRCALLRDTKAPDLPSDLLDRLYRRIDLDRADTVAAQVHRFVRDDLQLPSCGTCEEAISRATA